MKPSRQLRTYSKTPIRDHGGSANQGSVLLGDLNRSGSGKEVKVQNSSCTQVFQVVPARFILVQPNIHAVRRHEQNTVGPTSTLLKVDRVSPIQVLAMGNCAGISRPEGSGVVFGNEPEWICVLAESIQIGLRRQPGLDSQKLSLEDKTGARGVEQDFSSALSHDLERERVAFLDEFEREPIVRAGVCRVKCRAREYKLWDLIPNASAVLDEDMYA